MSVSRTECDQWCQIDIWSKNSGKSLPCEVINARRCAYFEIQIKIIFDSNIEKQKYVRDSFLCKKM